MEDFTYGNARFACLNRAIRFCRTDAKQSNKKGKPDNRLPFFISKSDLNGLTVNSFFFDSCFLTGKSTQIVQFSATNFTYLVHFDAIDSR